MEEAELRAEVGHRLVERLLPQHSSEEGGGEVLVVAQRGEQLSEGSLAEKGSNYVRLGAEEELKEERVGAIAIPVDLVALGANGANEIEPALSQRTRELANLGDGVGHELKDILLWRLIVGSFGLEIGAIVLLETVAGA